MKRVSVLLRTASVLAVVLAGSCAAPYEPGRDPVDDPAINHPIAVEPHFTSIKLSFSSAQAGLLPDEAARLDAFVEDYLSRGSGSISVSAPAGAGSEATITYFGQRLFNMGVQRSRILVGTHDGGQVEIGFIAYAAHADPCGDWSEDLAKTASNRTAKNFGCSVRRNMAAQVADPRDLIEQRTMETSDAERRSTIIGHYEKGEITQANKHTSDQAVEQSAGASSVGQ